MYKVPSSSAFALLQTKDRLGNIKTKSDVGKYEYGAKPHALTDIKHLANPNSISLLTQTIEYNEMQLPKKINENDFELELFYGNGTARVKSTLKLSGQLQKTKVYNGDYETEITGTITKKYHYIEAPTGIAAIAVLTGNSTEPEIFYTYTDYLGSLTHVTNQQGVVLDEISYDAWGRKRNPANMEEYEEDMAIPPTHIFNRGYTFHEHLNEFKLINMNARLYDPAMGRMLSPDNAITDPNNSQDYNSYSYARNNPLKFTDPTGNVVTPSYNWGNDGGGSESSGASSQFGTLNWLEQKEERAIGMHIYNLITQLEDELKEKNKAEEAKNNDVKKSEVKATNETIAGETETNTDTKVASAGEKVDYSNKAAKDFLNEHFGELSYITGVFAETPEGYTLTDGGKAFLIDGEKGLGATIKNTNATTSNIFFAEGAFDSKEKLYLVMGHEIIHAACNNLGLDNGAFQEYAARRWQYKQARIWNSQYQNTLKEKLNEIDNYYFASYKYRNSSLSYKKERPW